MHNNLDVIRGMYSAFARGDVAGVLATLTPDIVWIEAEGFPSAGTYTTPDAVLHNVFMRLATEWDAFGAAPNEYVCDRESVVAIGDYAGTYKATGKAFKAPFAHLWKLRGGVAWSGFSSSRTPRSFSGPCGKCFSARMTMSLSSKPERDPAEVYDELFVPALFAQWGPRVAEAAALELGQRVLDVGCGTGVLACAAAQRVGTPGRVVGLDPNEQMLAVARRKPASVTWQLGRAEALPFNDASFDAVVSQFALMFFDPKPTAIAEMLRVLRPRGRMAVAVWDSLARAPGYRALTELLRELFGADIAGAMQAPFTLGDRTELLRLFAEGGAADAEVQTHPGTVRFASIDAMVSTERACVWTLGGLLDEQQFTQLRRHAQNALKPFIRSDGSVQFNCPAHLVTATRFRGKT